MDYDKIFEFCVNTSEENKQKFNKPRNAKDFIVKSQTISGNPVQQFQIPLIGKFLIISCKQL